MKHFSTLEAYDNLVAAGTSPSEARAQVKNMNNFFTDIAFEFTANKTVSIFGTLIVAIGGFLLVEVWSLSVKVESVGKRLGSIEEHFKD